MNPHLEYLDKLNASLNPAMRKLNEIVLFDGDFTAWPASASKHHNYDGGLLEHTAEVVQAAGQIELAARKPGRPIPDLFQHSLGPLKWTVLFTAALWHDYGKIWDYERHPQWEEVKDSVTFEQQMGKDPDAKPYLGKDGKPVLPWRNTQHRDRIRHVARSYAEFMHHVQNLSVHKENEEAPFDPEWVQEVGHCILSHHGRLDWGSPTEPQTPEAWALHLADMTSVRVFNRGTT